jgi:hypothetical protein
MIRPDEVVALSVHDQHGVRICNTALSVRKV